MKRWQVVVVISVLAVAAVVAGGTFFYRYYIVPKYLAPAVEKVSSYLQDDDVLAELYDQAERLHEDGVIEDETYSNFIRAYRKRLNNNEEAAKEILKSAGESIEEEESADSSVTTRYASNKVGVEIIQTNEGGGGKSKTSYSSERTSDRIKAEDIVEAEKVIEEANATPAPEEETEETVDTVDEAYNKLRETMTSDEFSAFVSIMSKLDIDTLIENASNEEDLKAYMHSQLTDEEYRRIVDLGYKYAYLFME